MKSPWNVSPLHAALFLAALAASACVTATAWSAAAEVGENTPADPASCRQCHRERYDGWSRTAHARSGSCLSCHPSEALHPASNGSSGSTAQTTENLRRLYDPQSCARCHESEYREWQQSAHHEPVPYTRDEIAPELIGDCVKCHNAAGHAAVLRSGKDFATAKGPNAAAASPGVTCVACHDPHTAMPFLLRVGSPAKACDTCHGIKWQTLALNGTGGQRYSDSSYADVARSPHNTGDRCVGCHMARQPGLAAGGHTLRMRDGQGRPLTAPCLSCHPGLRDFNLNGKQEEVKGLLSSLEEMLKAHNGGELPGFQPGKCNRCHRGGTLPFKDDPQGLLEQAFQNYRFFLNDRSFGVHNPTYTVKLLQDSKRHIQQGYGDSAAAGENDQACATCGH
ncbi:MAG TPA: hypothetical protein GXX28_01325 [Firmicutes bacterium]|nr:hypothetical protein [Bacillota bacterium]